MSLNSTEALTEEKNSKLREGLYLLILTVVHFSHILDFVIIMPLGPQFMRLFSINATEFGLLVSSYTFSAAVGGILSALWVDRFDRKKTLLFLYGGFTLGTLCCALAPNYSILMLARIISGLFGGVLGATVFSIIGDLIPFSRRGVAMGTVMSSFALASVLGVPLGLFLANLWGWHAAFYFIILICLPVWFLALGILPKMSPQLQQTVQVHPLRNMLDIIKEPQHLKVFLFMMTVVVSGFSVIPFISPYLVSNTGLLEADLPYVYFIGGLMTIFSSYFIGRLADKIGKQKAFRLVASLSIVPVLALTHWSFSPLWQTLVVTTLFMILVSGRFVPAMTIISGSVKPNLRGSFMSINSAVQQLSSSTASLIGGAIIISSTDGQLLHYDWVGYISVIFTLLSILVSTRIKLVQ